MTAARCILRTPSRTTTHTRTRRRRRRRAKLARGSDVEPREFRRALRSTREESHARVPLRS
ncbi:hypothetical protein ALC56_04325 [Trachymyrmex septentrionalis]|uniref:Uncharacterized protein n=1 Tax=Trachymyrmex septentrionalis TaxID=34720 RepID=A0A195FMJ9_9HYME|nr:hypothetical protein ALC56_04325 [Trachymyrmex septentrionalis]